MDDSSLQTNKQIISNNLNPINYRFKDFDLARGIAIIFMILQHSFWVFGKYPTTNSFDSISIEIAITLGGISAPVFMFLMGLFFGFKKEKSIKYGLTRGVKLIGLGYVLNIFRFVIPFSIGTELMLIDYPVLFEGFPSPIWEIFFLDILQFAGLALIILTLIKKYCREKESYSFIIAMLAIFLALFSSFFITNSPLDFFLGYFWSNSYSGFPLFPTLFYPMIGLIIGQRLRKRDFLKNNIIEKVQFHALILTLIGILTAGFVVYFLISIFIVQIEMSITLELTERVFLTPCLMLLFFLLIFPLFNIIVSERAKNPIFNYIYFLSKHITVIYIIQWILIGWSILIFKVQLFSAIVCALLFLFIMFLTSALSFLYVKTKTILTR